MPPKDSESLLDNIYFGVPSGDGRYEYKPVGKVEHIDITDVSSMLPRLGEDMYGHFCKVKPGTTKLGWVAITEMIWNGNSLYFRFPKKAKRKLRKYNRCKRASLIRWKKWCPPIIDIWKHEERNDILQKRMEDYPWIREEV